MNRVRGCRSGDHEGVSLAQRQRIDGIYRSLTIETDHQLDAAGLGARVRSIRLHTNFGQAELLGGSLKHPFPGNSLESLCQPDRFSFETQDGQQLLQVLVFWSQPAPYHVVRVGHQFDSHSFQIGVEKPRFQKHRVPRLQEDEIEQQRGEHPGVSGIQPLKTYEPAGNRRCWGFWGFASGSTAPLLLVQLAAGPVHSLLYRSPSGFPVQTHEGGEEYFQSRRVWVFPEGVEVF